VRSGLSQCDEVTLPSKGARSRTPGRKLRSAGTKARTRPGRTRQPAAVLEQQLEISRRELAEAREQQTATSEMLRVISSSPAELQPVFETILAKAVNICEAKFGTLYLYDRGTFEPRAFHNAPPAFIEARKSLGRIRPPPDSTLGVSPSQNE
jgi:hypothetical protein